jgi:periplasmic protein TonB
VKKATVIISVIIHGALAVALLTASQRKASGKNFFVQMTEEKKKEIKEKEKEKAKAAPPKPKLAKIDRPAEAKPMAAPKVAPVAEAPAPTAKIAAAPVAMDLAMSNEDIGDAIAIPVAPRQVQAVAAAKVASMDAEPRRRRVHELGPGGPIPTGEERCTDEPSKPEPVFKTEIEYTAAARAEGIEGKLKLRVVVGADGSVVSVDVLSSVSPELDAAAIAAVKRWRFKPAMACGKPVAGGTYVLARRFELGD